MENQGFSQEKFLKDQMKYLGFGESKELHDQLQKGMEGENQKFEIKTTSDKTLPGNVVEFTLKFNKVEQGTFLNSYNANLKNEKGEEFIQNFAVKKETNYTAKEAINLLEGRAVKTELLNNDKVKEPVFVKLKLNEEKNDYGNYKLEVYNKNYGVDTTKIVEKSNLIFDKPEQKEQTIKALEKGNIVKVKFDVDNKIIEGKAVLNPQYKNINLYDSQMNRLNTNKPLQGINEEKNIKSNVKEQSISRGL